MSLVRRCLPWASECKPRHELDGDGRIRDGMVALEEHWRTQDGHIEGDNWVDAYAGGNLEHNFVDGLYVRKVVMPGGMLFTTKIHKVNHPFFMTEGKCRVLTEEGVVDLVAPHHGITKAGTKRLMYIVETMTWYTIHATKETDPAEVEKEVIAKDFGEFDIKDEDIKRLTETE